LPLFRTSLIELDKNDYLMLFSIHHIISDAWSMSIFLDEFIKRYHLLTDGIPIKLQEKKLHYKDYANWQKQLFESTEITNSEIFWLEQFNNFEPEDSFPSDKKRPIVRNYDGRSVRRKTY
jgi:hypothetical protein